MKVTLRQKISEKRAEYAPGTFLHVGEKNYSSVKNERRTVKFVNSFILALSVIFTQPVWKRMYLGF